MLYWLLQQTDIAIGSLTLRALLAVITSLLIVIIGGKPVIHYLRTLKYGQAVRDDGPKTHLAKQGTPTMGGVLILVAIGIATLAWADLGNPYVWILMVVMVIFGAVGWADDWLKIKHKNPPRTDCSQKIFLAIGRLAICWLFDVLHRHTARYQYHDRHARHANPTV